ncbi:putative SOS response-associated peptidase YedK [Metabacillus crassostreae]|uniref:SOS response-associated peptidase family protein n=1 Tax=Metabacillus crassostreae TaxID=929098 RepID=UPI00195A562F|nr:putative SOS response-associated peptidase YedK [Metabacillus crassostreae]
MCGRFSLATDQEILQNQFNFILNDEILNRYNIAPSQNVLVIGSNGKERVGTKMRWGLVPPWSKDTKISYKMINARSETIDEKVSFKNPFLRKRCLILSDGFYEWKKNGTEKQPYRFKMKNNLPFAFAGLWERWDKGDTPLFTCTIITTKANTLTEDVHDRMPVILPADAHNKWLDRDFGDMKQLKSLLIPYNEEEMEKYPVSNIVNSPHNDSAECLERLNSL